MGSKVGGRRMFNKAIIGGMVVIFIALIGPNINAACPQATSLDYPVHKYLYNFNLGIDPKHGYKFWEPVTGWGHHLGEDVKLPEGMPIQAIGNGEIVYYGPATAYGELVVAIEHDLGREYEFVNGPGKIVRTQKILSIYGHLRTSKERGGPSLKWKVGDCVTQGETIGYINDDEHNGVPTKEHLHMGLRLSDKNTAWKRDGTYWLRGYDGDKGTECGTECSKDFAAASSVIEKLRSPQPPSPEQRPTISVSTSEEVDERTCRWRPPDPPAKTALVRKLLENGLQVVSANSKIAVEGEGFCECDPRPFDGLRQARARLEVKVTDTSTGRILSSEALHTGGVDVTPGAAAKRALQRAGDRMGECLVLKLNRGWTTPCKAQSASSSSLRQIAEVGVNNFESEVWTGGWDAREGMKEMLERALRDRGIKVVVPVAADLVVSGAITDYRVIYQVNILIFRIGIAYMTVEPQVFNLETAEIERGDEITDFAGGIEILGFRFGFGPQAVAKKISNQIADWVESKVK